MLAYYMTEYCSNSKPQLKNPVTIVTFYYDLSLREDRNFRPYIEDSKHILSINKPMIIYTDPKHVDLISKIRNKSDMTIIIPKTLEEFEYYQYYDKAKQFFNDGKMKKLTEAWPKKYTAIYSIMTWTKFAVLNEVIQMNPFFSDKIVWIDFGLYHLINLNKNVPFGNVIKLNKTLDNLPDEIQLMRVRAGVRSEEDHFVSIYANHACGFFSASLSNMSWLVKEFNKRVALHVEKGYASLEEHIITVIIQDYPDRFREYYGSYASILENIEKPLYCHDNIIQFIFRQCRLTNDFALGEKVGEQLFSVRECMALTDLTTFLDEYSLILCYGPGKNMDRLAEVVNEICLCKHLIKDDQMVRIKKNIYYFNELLQKNGKSIFVF
jgi:hypothetical protein